MIGAEICSNINFQHYISWGMARNEYSVRLESLEGLNKITANYLSTANSITTFPALITVISMRCG